MENVIIVEGFSFTDENMGKQAEKEAEGVRYVKSKTDMSNPKEVHRVYQRLLAQKTFQTPVGYAYLRELQEYLISNPSIENREVGAVPVAANLKVNDAMGVAQRLRLRVKSERRKFRISMFANLVLALTIAVMFAIALSSDQTTILNYEKKLQDRYAKWEQELTKREQIIREEEQMMDLEFDTWADE